MCNLSTRTPVTYQPSLYTPQGEGVILAPLARSYAKVSLGACLECSGCIILVQDREKNANRFGFGIYRNFIQFTVED